VVSKRTVIDLRCFFDDLALWGYSERPPARLLFPADIPRLDKPLPRALPPDADRDPMAVIGELADLTALRDDAAARGWHTEVARHSRVIASIQKHLKRLQRTAGTGHNA
jgi:hypothetical protein